MDQEKTPVSFLEYIAPTIDDFAPIHASTLIVGANSIGKEKSYIIVILIFFISYLEIRKFIIFIISVYLSK